MADIPLVQLPYPEEETRTFELSTSLSPNWDKNGRIFYTDETGQVVRPQAKYNPLQMLGRRLKAFGSNAKNFVEDFNMDKTHTYFAPFEDINEQYKAGNINKSELPYLTQGRAEQEIRDAQQQERDNINRGWLGTGLSAASMLPIFNIPYIGTGLGGAMYDLGQGITEGNNAGELWDRTKRGFAIGESVGAIPYVGQLAGKTKVGQAVSSALNKAGEKFANTKLYDALMTDIRAFNPNKQTVYHGSPYDFNKFSNEAIGTGEGAQAHGYGHYAALNKDVAEGYADRLGHYNLDNPDKIALPYGTDTDIIQANYFGKEEQIKRLQNQIEIQKDLLKTDPDNSFAWQAEIDHLNTRINNLNKYYDKFKLKADKQLYKLSIPKDDVMLREDAIFAEQPKKVQDFINDYRINKVKDISKDYNDFKDFINYNDINLEKTFGTKYTNDAYEIFKNNPEKYFKLYDVGFIGKDFYNQLVRDNYTAKNVNNLLNKHGIKGISYNGGIDGEARVIFNPDDIVIGRKYYNQPNLYEQLTGKQNTGALVDALFNR